VNIRTLGLSGLDRDEENRFRQLFEAVAEPGWALASENDAGVLVIDFDSMYGQMTWLRAQGGPRPIVALTAGTRADATHVLKRPVSEKALKDLLRRLVNQVPEVADEGAIEPEPLSQYADSTYEPRLSEPAATHAAPMEPETAPIIEELPPRQRVLLDFLQPGVLAGPALLRDAQPPLAVNVSAGQYLGGSTLKPLAPHCARAIDEEDWEPLSPADFKALQAEMGEPQPLNRLLWLAGLNGFDGQLCPALADALRFKLAKWPQTEREFPRQFRIATALLKQLGTPEEAAAACGASVSEVIDYINACQALGIIEAERPAPPAPITPEAPARGGLLGRLRRG
jgi:hypothetical protein